MDVRAKLAIMWLACGLVEIVGAHLFIARKKDPFADPNAWLAGKWIRPVRHVQAMADTAMDAKMISRRGMVDVTVATMTQMGLGLILLAGLLFVHPWSTATVVIISVVWMIAVMAYPITVLVLRCTRLSKGG